MCKEELFLFIHCNTWQHIATHCNTERSKCLKRSCFSSFTATHGNTLQHTATQKGRNVYRGAVCLHSLQHTATHCNTLQHTATHSTQNGRNVQGGAVSLHPGRGSLLRSWDRYFIYTLCIYIHWTHSVSIYMVSIYCCIYLYTYIISSFSKRHAYCFLIAFVRPFSTKMCILLHIVVSLFVLDIIAFVTPLSKMHIVCILFSPTEKWFVSVCVKTSF